MAKNWTHLFEKYRGKWVALAEDETTVLAAAETAIVLSFFIGRQVSSSRASLDRPPLVISDVVVGVVPLHHNVLQNSSRHRKRAPGSLPCAPLLLGAQPSEKP
jgi:hypothetical protein